MKLKVWPLLVGAILVFIVGVVTSDPTGWFIGVFMFCLAASIDLGGKP